MSLDSVFILSHIGEILIQKDYKTQNNAVTAQLFYTEYQKSKSDHLNENIYPLIKVKNNLCAFLTSSDLIFMTVLTEDLPILSIYSILFALIDIMKNAFNGQISSEKIRNNFSSILVMLDHFLDYGFPLITQRYVLESMIKPFKMMDKIEEALVGKNQHSKDNSQILEKYVEGISDIKPYAIWRINDYKASEEIFFDVIEYADCIMEKNGNCLVQNVNGEIKVNSHLSGVPEINLFLNLPIKFDDYAIHECLFDRIESLETEKVLNFIPPTGSFVLMSYNMTDLTLNLPFEVIHNLKFHEKDLQLNLKIEPRLVRGAFYVVDEFHVKLILPNGLMQKDTENTAGTLNISEDATSVLWKLGELKKDISNKLQIIFEKKEGAFVDSKTFTACLKFQITSFSMTGTKIEKADVKNTTKTLVKKARNVTKSGYYEIRLN